MQTDGMERNGTKQRNANNHIKPSLLSQTLTKKNHPCIQCRTHPLSDNKCNSSIFRFGECGFCFSRPSELFLFMNCVSNVRQLLKPKHNIKFYRAHPNVLIVDSETSTINQNGNQMHYTMWSTKLVCTLHLKFHAILPSRHRHTRTLASEECIWSSVHVKWKIELWWINKEWCKTLQ